MKRKHLESALSSIQNEFQQPNILLEQYPTTPELASYILLNIVDQYPQDIGPGCSVLDLGCGTGMLSIGCALLECDMVYGIDCDNKAIAIAQNNTVSLELQNRMEYIQAQVRNNHHPINTNGENNNDDHDDDDHNEDDDRQQNKSASHNNNNNKNKNQQQQRSNKNRNHGRNTNTSSSKFHKTKKGNNNNSIGQQSHVVVSDTINSTPYLRQYILDTTYHDGIPLPNKMVDTVITNPPFGTKNNPGMDLRFVRTACRLAKHTVYSFHKTSTRSFLLHTIQKEWNEYNHHHYSENDNQDSDNGDNKNKNPMIIIENVSVIAQMKFQIPKMYSFHKQECIEVDVDLIRIVLGGQDHDHNNKNEINKKDQQTSTTTTDTMNQYDNDNNANNNNNNNNDSTDNDDYYEQDDYNDDDNDENENENDYDDE